MATKSRRRQCADRLRTLKQRGDAGRKAFTVQGFAERCGVPATTVREWLNAKVLPRGEALLIVADEFDVSLDWLLGRIGDAASPMRPSEGERHDDLPARLRAHIVRLIEKDVRMDPFIAKYLSVDRLIPESRHLLGEVEDMYRERVRRAVEHEDKAFYRDLRRTLAVRRSLISAAMDGSIDIAAAQTIRRRIRRRSG